MFTIHISKADRDVEVDFEKLPPASIAHVIRYGLTQMLNDAHASVSAKDPEAAGIAWSLAIKKLDAIKAGTLRAGGGGRTTDPVKARAITIALPYAKAKLEKGADATAIRRKAIEMVAANPAFGHLAQKQLDEEAALGLDSVPDLDDDGAE